MKIARMFAAWVSLGLLAALAIPLSLAKSQANPAKEGAGKQMGKHEKLEAAIESLHLTEDQQAKVKDILADAKTKRQALWADTSLSEEQKKAKMKELHEALLGKLNGVLTPEQQSELKSKMTAAKEKPQS